MTANYYVKARRDFSLVISSSTVVSPKYFYVAFKDCMEAVINTQMDFVMNSLPKLFRPLSIITVIALLDACGGGGSGHSAAPAKYSLAGSVSGLSNNGLVLSDGVQSTPQSLTLQANTSNGSSAFSFNGGAAYLMGGAQYNVAIQHQPIGNRCLVTNGAGNISGNVTSIVVDCLAPTVSIFLSPTSYQSATNNRGTNGPTSIALDAMGNVYTASQGQLLKTTPAGAASIIALVDAIAHTPITNPGIQQVAVDATGKIYVAANPSGVGSVIQMIDANGLVTTIAGSGVIGSDNGIGTSASFSNWIKGIVLDAHGNIFAADLGNNMIRKIAPDGSVSTFAGSGAQGSTDGPEATASFNLNGAEGNIIAIDSAANIYVVEWLNDDVRKISPSGNVSTFAGNVARFGETDGAGITTASFGNPFGIATDSRDNVYVLDGSSSIRMIQPDGSVSTLLNSGAPIYDSNNNVVTQNSAPKTCIASTGDGTLYFGATVISSNFSGEILKTIFR